MSCCGLSVINGKHHNLSLFVNLPVEERILSITMFLWLGMEAHIYKILVVQRLRQENLINFHTITYQVASTPPSYLHCLLVLY